VLLASSPGQPRREIGAGALPDNVVWFDLFAPSDQERHEVEVETGLRVPRAEEIDEIESSSRLRQEGEGIYLSMPLSVPNADGTRSSAAVGFVLSRTHLLTLRYANIPVFDRFAETQATTGEGHGSAGVLVGLMEALVDRLADLLEKVNSDLEHVSKRVFHTEGMPGRKRDESSMLRATLTRIGLAGDLVSNLRASLLGIGRIVPYLTEAAAAWLPDELKPRLVALKADLLSLTDFDAQMMSKVQFLLDATLGFLNIEQNDGLKVLTVVSVVGIPPTLIASMYGMNFQHMPELHWAWGYEYGLSLIALSIVLPLVWFRVKGWV
jgi:magnesium transporter